MLFTGLGNRARCRERAVGKLSTAGEGLTANVVSKQVGIGGVAGD